MLESCDEYTIRPVAGFNTFGEHNAQLLDEHLMKISHFWMQDFIGQNDRYSGGEIRLTRQRQGK